MAWLRAGVAGGAILAAVILQSVVLVPLGLPWAVPDLALVIVVAFAVHLGPAFGAAAGFWCGLLLDATPPSDSALGRWALVLTLVGWAAGQARELVDRTPLTAVLVVAASGAAAVLGFATVAWLLGDVRVTAPAVATAAAGAALYDGLLAVFVVPLVGIFVKRTLRPSGAAGIRW